MSMISDVAIKGTSEEKVVLLMGATSGIAEAAAVVFRNGSTDACDNLIRHKGRAS